MEVNYPPYPKQLISSLQIGDRIRLYRLQKGFYATDLAKELGVTKDTIWNWENHRTNPQGPKMRKILKLIKKSPKP